MTALIGMFIALLHLFGRAWARWRRVFQNRQVRLPLGGGQQSQDAAKYSACGVRHMLELIDTDARKDRACGGRLQGE